MTLIRIGLADDQPLFRAGIRMVLDSQADLEVIWEASDGSEAIRSARDNPVDIILMDVEMPVLDGVQATIRILEEQGDRAARIVVLTTFELNDRTFQAIQAGASGFLLKSAEPEFLLASIRTVAKGNAVVAPTMTAALIRRFATRSSSIDSSSLTQLTPREREIFELIVSGLSNNEIAEKAFLSDTTVKTHVSRILSKLGLRDRVQLVIFAYESGLIGGP